MLPSRTAISNGLLVAAIAAALSSCTSASAPQSSPSPSEAPTSAPAAASPPIRVHDIYTFEPFWHATAEKPLQLRIASGRVHATVTYPIKNDSRFRVTDGGRVVIDMIGGNMPRDMRFARLEGAQNVVLLDMFSGGAHCCFSTALANPSDRAHPFAEIEWRNIPYTLIPSARGNGSVFLSADDTGAYDFSSYADSRAPIRILSYRNARFIDVTNEYPNLIENDAAAQWRGYTQRQSNAKDDVQGPRPPLVAYIADEYRLGRGEEAWDRARASYGRSRAFYAAARAWLSDQGYTQIPQIAATRLH
jgi:hypothetical protein